MHHRQIHTHPNTEARTSMPGETPFLLFQKKRQAGFYHAPLTWPVNSVYKKTTMDTLPLKTEPYQHPNHHEMRLDSPLTKPHHEL